MLLSVASKHLYPLYLRSKLKAYLNIEMNQINDPVKKARDVKDIGHYSSGNAAITIKDRNEISYALIQYRSVRKKWQSIG
jgi:predicted transport protein